MSIRRVSAAGKALGKLGNAKGDHLAVDGVGNVFISQWETIEVRDAKAEIVRKFSQGPRGKLDRPSQIAFDGNHVLVRDGNSLLILDPEGQFLAELEIGSVNDIALDRTGALYTLDTGKVRKFELSIPSKP